MSNQQSRIEALQAIGGKLWEKDGRRRMYFNNLRELIGLELSFYGTGNISGAAFRDESISNSRARKIDNELYGSSAYYDLIADRVVIYGLRDSELVSIIEETILKAVK